MLKSVLIQSSLYRVRHCYTTLRWHLTDSVSSVTANMTSRWHYRQLLFGFIVASWCQFDIISQWLLFGIVVLFSCATINPCQDSVYTFSTHKIAHVKVHSVALSSMQTCTLPFAGVTDDPLHSGWYVKSIKLPREQRQTTAQWWMKTSGRMTLCLPSSNFPLHTAINVRASEAITHGSARCRSYVSRFSR